MGFCRPPAYIPDSSVLMFFKQLSTKINSDDVREDSIAQKNRFVKNSGIFSREFAVMQPSYSFIRSLFRTLQQFAVPGIFLQFLKSSVRQLCGKGFIPVNPLPVEFMGTDFQQR